MKKHFIIILLFVFSVIYFAPVIFSQKTFIARDIYIFFNPRRFFAAECMHSGSIPLWNPYLALGVPFQANLQSSIFYPLSLLYYVLPFQTGFKYFIILHYLLGSLFMFFLMKEWRCRNFAAMVSAIVFSFGGYLISIIDNVAFLTSAVWLPLILLLHHRTLKYSSFRYSLFTGIFIAIQIFAGDASFYFFSTLVCTSFYTAFWPFIKKSNASYPVLRTWCLLACSWLSGLVIAAVQLFPFLEFVHLSTRFDGLSYEKVTRWSYHPLELLQLFIPYVFGTTVPYTRWFGQRWLDTFYIGIFPFCFVIFFIFFCKAKIKRFLLAITACALFLCFGKYNPLFPVLYSTIPGINMLMYPVKLLFLPGFCLAIMAGMGASCFMEGLFNSGSCRGYLKMLTIMLVILVVLLLTGTIFHERLYTAYLGIFPDKELLQKTKEESFFSIFKGLSFTIIFFSCFLLISWAAIKEKVRKLTFMFLIVTITFIDLSVIGKTQEPFIGESMFTQGNRVVNFLKKDQSVFRIYSLAYIATKRSFLHLPGTPFEGIYRVLQEGLLPNLNIYYHLQSIDEYAALLKKDYYEIFSPVENFFTKDNPSPEEKSYRNKILDLFNVKYIVTPNPLADDHFMLVLDGKIKIYENKGVLPRAFFAKRLLIVDSEESVLKMLESPSFDPQNMVYISKKEVKKLHNEFIADTQNGTEVPFEGSVDFIEYQPNYIILKTKTNKSAFLITSENYYPGWKVFIDGEEKSVLRVDHTLRGVLVEKGEHKITFSFKPPCFRSGAVISTVSFLAVFAGIILMYTKRR